MRVLKICVTFVAFAFTHFSHAEPIKIKGLLMSKGFIYSDLDLPCAHDMGFTIISSEVDLTEYLRTNVVLVAEKLPSSEIKILAVEPLKWSSESLFKFIRKDRLIVKAYLPKFSDSSLLADLITNLSALLEDQGSKCRIRLKVENFVKRNAQFSMDVYATYYGTCTDAAIENLLKPVISALENDKRLVQLGYDNSRPYCKR